MATPVQRATTILNALLDSTIPTATLQKLGEAYAYTYRRGENLTGQEKATVFLNVTRQQIKQIVADAIRSQAAAAAAEAADSSLDVGVDE